MYTSNPCEKAYLHFCHLLAGQPLQVGQLQQVIHLHPLNALVQILQPSAAGINVPHCSFNEVPRVLSTRRTRTDTSCLLEETGLGCLTWDLFATQNMKRKVSANGRQTSVCIPRAAEGEKGGVCSPCHALFCVVLRTCQAAPPGNSQQ